MPSELTERIDATLPQTQCGGCGYRACRPYAEAIAGGEVDIDRCAPGGQRTRDSLAALLGIATKGLDPRFGHERLPRTALIDERRCIGCTLCIQACPIDAIVGAARRTHTVVGEWCSGCELCIVPCPVDCIELVAVEREWTLADAAAARARFDARSARPALGAGPGGGRDDGRGELDDTRTAAPLATGPRAVGAVPAGEAARRRAAIDAAIARARARRAAAGSASRAPSVSERS